ncbi:MAG: hypothetical protein Q7S05_02680 [bacterium]|nr:hypothetical protein [bacterium]
MDDATVGYLILLLELAIPAVIVISIIAFGLKSIFSKESQRNVPGIKTVGNKQEIVRYRDGGLRRSFWKSFAWSFTILIFCSVVALSWEYFTFAIYERPQVGYLDYIKIVFSLGLITAFIIMALIFAPIFAHVGRWLSEQKSKPASKV